MTDSNGLTQTLGALQDELTSLKRAVDHIGEAREAARKAVEVADNLVEQSNALAKATETLVEKIDKVDFPSRLHKLDATVSSVNLGLQKVQARVDGVEQHLNEQMKAVTKGVNRNVYVLGALVVLIVLLLVLSVVQLSG